MLRPSRRCLTPKERKECQTKYPFHILTRSDKCQERKDATVADANKAWRGWTLVPKLEPKSGTKRVVA